MLLLRKPCRTFISPQIKTKFQFPPQVSLDTAKFFWISRQMTKIQKNPNQTKIKKTTPNSKIIRNVVSKCSPCWLTKGRAPKLQGQEPGGVLEPAQSPGQPSPAALATWHTQVPQGTYCPAGHGSNPDTTGFWSTDRQTSYPHGQPGLPQKGRQRPKTSMGSTRTTGNRSPHTDTHSSSECPQGSGRLPAPPHSTGMPLHDTEWQATHTALSRSPC